MIVRHAQRWRRTGVPAEPGIRPRLAAPWSVLLTAALLGCAAPQPNARTSSPPASDTPQLYVLDCGRLIGHNLATYELPNEPRDMSVPCFLIKHPRGMLLWEAGLGDRFAGSAEQPRDTTWRVTTTLRSQLGAIGVQSEDITYLAMSHSHADHIGNANDHAGSTWLVQEAERAAMFRPGRNTAVFAKLENSRTILLHGDHDVFGDNTVVVKSTPGHTAGHQSLYVKLRRTGAVLLTGDLYHYPEQVSANTFPAAEFDRRQSAASRAAIQRLLSDTGGRLWIGHDIRTIDPLTKAPEFYD